MEQADSYQIMLHFYHKSEPLFLQLLSSLIRLIVNDHSVGSLMGRHYVYSASEVQNI